MSFNRYRSKNKEITRITNLPTYLATSTLFIMTKKNQSFHFKAHFYMYSVYLRSFPCKHHGAQQYLFAFYVYGKEYFNLWWILQTIMLISLFQPMKQIKIISLRDISRSIVIDVFGLPEPKPSRTKQNVFI